MVSSLLVNFFYAHPVGHAIEALRYCLGYHRADPELRIGLVLTTTTPTELAGCCRFVEATYPVRYSLYGGDDLPAAIAAIARAWDWVVDDPRGHQPDQRQFFPGPAGYYEGCREHLTARRGRGYAGAAPPAYTPHQDLRLDLPAESRGRARRLLGTGRPVIAVLPAGSGERWLYPSATSWELILRGLAAQHPAAVFCLVGKLAATAGPARRSRGPSWTASSGPYRPQWTSSIGRCSTSSPRSRPPTSWSRRTRASRWPRSRSARPGSRCPAGAGRSTSTTGVPFYSVLPDPDRYPCCPGLTGDVPTLGSDVDGEGRRHSDRPPAVLCGRTGRPLRPAAALLPRRHHPHLVRRRPPPRLRPETPVPTTAVRPSSGSDSTMVTFHRCGVSTGWHLLPPM